MVELLLRYKADPNTQNFMFGRSPLHYAVDCGHVGSVKLMLKYGANADIPDRQGNKPVDLAKLIEMQSALNDRESDHSSELYFYEENQRHEFGETFGKARSTDSRDLENYAAPTPPLTQSFNFEPDSELSVLPKQNHKPKPIFS